MATEDVLSMDEDALQHWLIEQHLPKAAEELNGYTGADLCALTLEDLRELVSEKDSARLFALSTHIMQQQALVELKKQEARASLQPVNASESKKIAVKQSKAPASQLAKVEEYTETHVAAKVRNHPAEDDVFCVSCWENERLYPILGWSSSLLPHDRFHYSDKQGQELTKEMAQTRLEEQGLPAVAEGMLEHMHSQCSPSGEVLVNPQIWAGDWCVDRDEGDDEGWVYAMNFDEDMWVPQSQYVRDNYQYPYQVRTRRWYRRTVHAAALSPNEKKQQEASSEGPTPDESNQLALLKATVRWSECFEHERYYPVLGWSDKLLPVDRPNWSDRDGKHEVTKASCVLDEGWRWDGLWVVDKSNADKDGWQYAVNFPAAYDAVLASIHTVRRRRWARKQVKEPKTTTPK